ncbi:MarR family winged helix-turn-helix transcriptional regulator [Paenibacillus wulumuqiensis]|uniref:MarR family winged helix-turn-helix transcriptional regulator n=1 Tax=Paenibacillus wulumuqiensis TaxID=1567107 RepID=UPI0006970D56|nr:MarR family transcriptional regulator [Paenibacillus wulumuqiensis]
METSGELLKSYLLLVDRMPRIMELPTLMRQLKSNTTEIFILHFLLNNGSQYGTDIVKATGLTTSAVTQICDKLEQEELIERTRSDQDRRYVSISITRKGGRALDKIFSIMAGKLVENIRELNDEDADELLLHLRSVEHLILKRKELVAKQR